MKNKTLPKRSTTKKSSNDELFDSILFAFQASLALIASSGIGPKKVAKLSKVIKASESAGDLFHNLNDLRTEIISLPDRSSLITQPGK